MSAQRKWLLTAIERMELEAAETTIRIDEATLVVTQRFNTGVRFGENLHGSGGGSSTKQQPTSGA
jgi:hypothetical protein